MVADEIPLDNKQQLPASAVALTHLSKFSTVTLMEKRRKIKSKRRTQVSVYRQLCSEVRSVIKFSTSRYNLVTAYSCCLQMLSIGAAYRCCLQFVGSSFFWRGSKLFLFLVFRKPKGIVYQICIKIKLAGWNTFNMEIFSISQNLLYLIEKK